MRHSICVLFTILICLLTPTLGTADSAKRPKVGLVLEGGGALGFAHVGVLKVLEENRIPVDMIAGTSMGAIVGASYASGQSIEVMTEVLSGTDWEELFLEKVARAELPYRLKPGRDRELYGAAKFGLKDGKLALPTALVEGQRVLPVLQRLYEYAPYPTDFDNLPIPFRAVAADIETGEAVILKEGDLSLAVRASMAAPGAFAPIEMNGRLLVDGAIVYNLPVDIARGMGADVLIVVSLETALKKREELTDLLSISAQILDLLMLQNSKEQLAHIQDKDVLINVELSEYSAGSFAEGKKIMAIGEAAARETLGKLQKLSLSAEEYAAYKKQRRPAQTDTPVIQFVNINNNSSVSDKVLAEAINLKIGEPFDREEVDKEIERLYRSSRFREVRYQLVKEEDQTGLELTASEKEWFQQNFRLGFAMEYDFDRSRFALGTSWRRYNLNRYGAEMEIDVEIGRAPLFSIELYHPLGLASPYFVAPSFRIGSEDIFLRSDDEIIAEYDRSTGLGELRLGRSFLSSGEASIGISRGWGDVSREVGDPLLPEQSFDIGNITALGIYDTLDSPDFPTSGRLFDLRISHGLEEFGSSNNFTQTTANLALPFTDGINTLILAGKFGGSYDDLPADQLYSLGGFLNISGFRQGELLTSDYFLGQTTYFRKLAEIGNKFFGLSTFAGGTLEYALLKSNSPVVGDEDNIFSGSVFLGLDTPLLPVYFAFGASDKDRQSFYLALGRVLTRRRR